MIYRIFPCIVKHHGSFKYLKYISPKFRQKGSNSKSTPTAKVFASSPNTQFSNNSFENLKSEVKGVTGEKSQLSSSHINGCSEIQQHFKPVMEPDVTVLVAETKSKEEDTSEKSIKLLNTVKPTFLEWHKQDFNWQSLPNHYKGLSKFRLSGLVIITALAGYGMAPGPLELNSLLCMVIGTGLTSAAANAVNQVLEVPYDSQMNRTKNRVLIRGFITSLHASVFAVCSASIGLTTLYLGTNSLTAILGLTNLILYTSVYTPLKRCSIINTWLGSIVGAIPPLMGWAACTGTLNCGALLMGAILYSWQFPHFNALSWNLRADYSRAGYRMTSVIDPDLCRIAALRHSIGLLAFCSMAPLVDLTTWTFAFDSFPLNCYLIYCAWNFYKEKDSKSARKLFRLSLIYLPTLMFLMFIGKKHVSREEKSNLKL